MDFQELCKRAFAVVNPRELSELAEAGSVGAALETDTGNVYVGVCMDIACSVVAVNRQGEPMPPCGRCRELITALHPENDQAQVMVARDTVLTLEKLLPYDWKAAKRQQKE